MHSSSLRNMKRFVANHLDKSTSQRSVLDVGSQDVNGNYRHLFDTKIWTYTGLDMTEGANVDIIPEDPYSWSMIPDRSFDVVISGQSLEHVEFFWLTIKEMERVLKCGGYLCLIAPSNGYEHRYPVDCWRFYPDGMKALAKYVNIDVLEVYAEWDDQYEDRDPIWQDCVLIAQKPL